MRLGARAEWAVAGALRWAALTGLYLALVGQSPWSELIAGLLAGLAGAVLSMLLRGVAEPPVRLGAPWLRLAARLAWAILRDTERVGLALVRAVIVRHRGAIVRQPLERSGDGPAAAGHRALAILIASIAPNSYVLESRRSALVLHRLAPAALSEDRRWPI